MAVDSKTTPERRLFAQRDGWSPAPTTLISRYRNDDGYQEVLVRQPGVLLPIIMSAEQWDALEVVP